MTVPVMLHHGVVTSISSIDLSLFGARAHNGRSQCSASHGSVPKHHELSYLVEISTWFAVL